MLTVIGVRPGAGGPGLRLGQGVPSRPAAAAHVSLAALESRAGRRWSGARCKVTAFPPGAGGQRAPFVPPPAESRLRGLTASCQRSSRSLPAALSDSGPCCGSGAAGSRALRCLWAGGSGSDESAEGGEEIHLCFSEPNNTRCLRRARLNYRGFRRNHSLRRVGVFLPAREQYLPSRCHRVRHAGDANGTQGPQFAGSPQRLSGPCRIPAIQCVTYQAIQCNGSRDTM